MYSSVVPFLGGRYEGDGGGVVIANEEFQIGRIDSRGFFIEGLFR
jgi:hypothetical protein